MRLSGRLCVAAGLALLASSAEAKVPESRPYTVVAFGTSISVRGGWQKPLAETLSACLKQPVHVRTVAGAGKASDWGLKNIGRVNAIRPDAVIMEFAINDADIRHWIGLHESRRNTMMLLARLQQANPAAKVILMTTNPVTGWKRLLRPKLDIYYEQYRVIAAAHDIPLIDGERGWWRLPGAHRTDALPDGVHPKPRVFAAAIIPEVQNRMTCR